MATKNTYEKNSSVNEYLDDLKSLVKGEDPDDCITTCLELCQTFLSSYWLTLGIDDIEVERLTGGMTNQIYRCKALTTNGVEDNETPNEAVIRFYGKKYDLKTCPIECRFYDGMVAWIASSEGLGPKVYGLFERGQVLKYYKHRLMGETDLNDPDKLERVAHMLTKFHCLKPPMEKSKTKDWFTSLMSSLVIEDYYNDFIDENKSFLQKNDCKAVLNLDLKTEVLWVTERIASFESPIVFSHNDFRMGNILMTDSNGIVLTDFDYSIYSYRGFDFALFFNEFGKIVDNRHEFKDESIVRQFITSYVKQCERMYGKHYSDNPLNSVQHILEECKQFLLCTTMYWFTLFPKYRYEIPIPMENLLIVINRYVELYQAIKLKLTEEHLV